MSRYQLSLQALLAILAICMLLALYIRADYRNTGILNFQRSLSDLDLKIAEKTLELNTDLHYTTQQAEDFYISRPVNEIGQAGGDGEKSGDVNNSKNYPTGENMKKLTRQLVADHNGNEHSWPVLLTPSYGEVFVNLNFSQYNEEDTRFLKERLPVYKKRAETIGQACAQHPELRSYTPKRNYVWGTKQTPNILWCMIPKVASSSWAINFLHMVEPNRVVRKRDRVHQIVDSLYPEPKTDAEKISVFTQAIRFMVVRHPFVRLVSAFRDKMQQKRPNPKKFLYKELQQKIISRYRKGGGGGSHPTFAEFVEFVLDQTRRFKYPGDWKKVHCWVPYYVLCGVCSQDFQLIVKLETMQEDTEFIEKLAKLNLKSSAWVHRRAGSSSEETALKLFKTLTKAQAEGLYQTYKADFDLFGYSPDAFINAAS